ncbi:hypothetical protein ACFL38_00960 [Candidatus Omnitrophota bacterium]
MNWGAMIGIFLGFLGAGIATFNTLRYAEEQYKKDAIKLAAVFWIIVLAMSAVVLISIHSI